MRIVLFSIAIQIGSVFSSIPGSSEISQEEWSGLSEILQDENDLRIPIEAGEQRSSGTVFETSDDIEESIRRRSLWKRSDGPPKDRGLPYMIKTWVNEEYRGRRADSKEVFQMIKSELGITPDYRKLYDYIRRHNRSLSLPSVMRKSSHPSRKRFPKMVVQWMRAYMDSNPTCSAGEMHRAMRIQFCNEDQLTLDQINKWVNRHYNRGNLNN